MKHVWKTLSLLLVMALITGCSASVPGLKPSPTSTATPPPTLVPLKDVTILPKSNRPNILFILTDDLEAKLGTMQYLPAVQQLLTSQGLSFNDYIISDSLCCPSRTTILRGQYSQNTGVYTNGPLNGGFDTFYQLQHENSTLATWLQQAGYRTALFGKYLNGYPDPSNRNYIPPGWNEWVSPAKGSPYTEFNYTLNENGKLVNFGSSPNDYMTDVLTTQVDNYLRAIAGQPQPFFIYLATYNPHEPATPAPRYANLFDNLQAPRLPSFNEADVSGKPPNIRQDPLLTGAQIQKIDELYRNRVRSMQAVDDLLVSVINTLQQTGQLQNTYILFTSDNGFHMGEHRLPSGKGRPYEEDIVVPLVIRGPGIPAGQVLGGYVVGNTDIAPTIADLAGVVPPAYVDGRSLVPLFAPDRPPEQDWRQGYLIQYFGDGAKESWLGPQAASLVQEYGELLEPPDPDQTEGTINPPAVFLGIRTPQYTYVEYPADGFRELYDISKDPYELNNLAFTADPGLLSQFSSWLKQLASCAAASCRSAEQIGIH